MRQRSVLSDQPDANPLQLLIFVEAEG